MDDGVSPPFLGLGSFIPFLGWGSFLVDDLLGFHSMHGMGWDGGWMTETWDEVSPGGGAPGIPHSIAGMGWDGVSLLWGLVVGSWAAT